MTITQQQMSATTTTDIDKVLSQTRSEWLQDRASKGQHFDKLVVGAAIFSDFEISRPVSLLTVRRAEHDDYYGGCFEMPSGKVDDSETIGEALARELFEETGLTLLHVRAQLPDFTYTTQKTVMENGKEIHIVKKACQLNFAVKTSHYDDPIKLNKEEHSEWCWMMMMDARDAMMTEEMRECIKNALQWAKEYLRFLPGPAPSAKRIRNQDGVMSHALINIGTKIDTFTLEGAEHLAVLLRNTAAALDQRRDLLQAGVSADDVPAINVLVDGSERLAHLGLLTQWM